MNMEALIPKQFVYFVQNINYQEKQHSGKVTGSLSQDELGEAAGRNLLPLQQHKSDGVSQALSIFHTTTAQVP